MIKKYRLLTNILDREWTGQWNGADFTLQYGETKLLPDYMAEKFAENMATIVFQSLKQDLVDKNTMAEMKNKMLGDVESLDIPDKTPEDIVREEIEFVNKKYLNK